MLNEKALANAAALVTLLTSAVCLIILAVAPDLLFSFFELVTHGVDLTPLRPSVVNISFVDALWGTVLLTAFMWLTLYVFGYLYNLLRKK